MPSIRRVTRSCRSSSPSRATGTRAKACTTWTCTASRPFTRPDSGTSTASASAPTGRSGSWSSIRESAAASSPRTPSSGLTSSSRSSTARTARMARSRGCSNWPTCPTWVRACWPPQSGWTRSARRCCSSRQAFPRSTAWKWPAASGRPIPSRSSAASRPSIDIRSWSSRSAWAAASASRAARIGRPCERRSTWRSSSTGGPWLRRP